MSAHRRETGAIRTARGANRATQRHEAPCKKCLIRIANIGIVSRSSGFKRSHVPAQSTHCQCDVNKTIDYLSMLGAECGHEGKGQSVCKPGSVSGFPPDDHSSGTPVAERLLQPTRTTDPETGWAEARVIPIRSCSRWGLPCRSRYRARGGLLHHLFTLTPAHRGGPISVALSLRSPSPGVTRHRVSVEPGLSSRTGFRPLSARSSNRLAGAVWHAPAGRSRSQPQSPARLRRLAFAPLPSFGRLRTRTTRFARRRLAPEAARRGFGHQPQSPAGLRPLACALRAGAACAGSRETRLQSEAT